MAFANIRSASKRARSMGKHHAWTLDYDSHPLAAVMQNYRHIIDAEAANEHPDFVSIIIWHDHIATHVNTFCDDNKIVGNTASEYWLEQFLWIQLHVVDFDKLV